MRINEKLAREQSHTNDHRKATRQKVAGALLIALASLSGCALEAGSQDEIVAFEQELKVVRANGADVIWSTSKQRNLPFCISSTGWPNSTFRNLIVTTYEAAALQWNRTADVGFSHATSQDTNCTTSNTNIEFVIKYNPDPTWVGHAEAFFPDWPRASRQVLVGPQNFGPDADYWLQARHELGHTLGFAHEWDTAGVRALTAQDTNSIMHSGSQLSGLDRQGSQSVYGIPWESWGGTHVGIPAASSWGSGRLDFFVRGNDSPTNNIHHIWHDNGTQGSWGNLSAPSVGLGSSPSAVGHGVGKIDVFVRGADGALWRKTYNSSAGGWAAWASEGGTISGRPGAASWGGVRWDVFAVGGGGNLYHKWYDGTARSWENWGKPSGVDLTGDVSATSRGTNKLDVVAKGTNGTIYHLKYDGPPTWASITSPVSGSVRSPVIIATGSNTLELYVSTNAGDVYRRKSTNGAWGSWNWLGRFQSDGIGAVSWGPGRVDLVARRSGSSALQHAYLSGGYWY